MTKGSNSVQVPEALPLGMIAAYRAEIAPLLHRARSLRRAARGDIQLELPQGRAVLAISGPGVAQARGAAHWLATEHRLAALISIGFAGGLTGEATAGKLVIATSVVDAGTGQSYDCVPDVMQVAGGLVGRVVTAPSVISQVAHKRALRERWNATAVDMEAAGVAQVAQATGIPFAALKAITDGPSDELAIDFARCFTANGTLSSVRIVIEGLRGLAQFRSLLLLARNSRAAAGSLAGALAGTKNR